MQPVQIGDEWFVVGPLIGPFESNEAAWRWVDKCQGYPVTRPEEVPLDLWKTAPGGIRGKQKEKSSE